MHVSFSFAFNACVGCNFTDVFFTLFRNVLLTLPPGNQNRAPLFSKTLQRHAAAAASAALRNVIYNCK